MARPNDHSDQNSEPRQHDSRPPSEIGKAHPYGGNPDLAGEAGEPGDRVQGSDGTPVSGKP